jgi:diguanylate cyclase (GGDEF)-like protein/PAS domain S-box-containing protein
MKSRFLKKWNNSSKITIYVFASWFFCCVRIINQVNLSSGKSRLFPGEQDAVSRGELLKKRSLATENYTSLLGPLSETVKDGVVLLDDSFRIVFANGPWTKMHKTDQQKVLGTDYRNYLAKQADVVRFHEVKEKLLTEDKGYCEADHISVGSGSPFAVETTASTFRHDPDKNQIILFERDISARRTAERLQNATYKIASAATYSETLPELFALIHKIISELIAAKNFYIALYDQKNELLEFPYFIDEFDEAPSPEPLGKNLTSYVVKSGKALLADPDNFQELIRKGEIVTDGAPSIDWLGVPLIVNSTPIGVIVVQSYTSGIRYGHREVDLLTFVSGQIATAIERRKTSDALREGEARLRVLAETTSAGIMIFEGETIKYVNPSAIKILAYNENEMYKKKFWEFLRSDYQQWIKERAIARMQGEDVPSNYEIVAVTKDGREVWLQLNVALIQFEGKPATLVTAFDISDRKKAEFSLKESEERFRTLAETTSAAIFIFRGQWIVYVNAASEMLTGYSRKELLSLQLWDLVHPDDFVSTHEEFAKQMKKGKDLSFKQLRILTKRGEEKWVAFTGGGSQLDGEEAIVATAFDITQIVQAQDNLKYLAHHDFLTGLENRWAFHENLLKAMEEAGEKNRNVALLFLDLDRFKELNDTEGHITGDKILRAAASRLSSTVEDSAGLGRIGSDEFTVILRNSGVEEAETMAKKILAAFDEPFTFSGKEFHISLSIGICVFPEDGEDLESLLKNADIAMFRAKADGGASYQFYRMEMSEEAKERIDMRNRLHGAIDRNELALYFQPIVEQGKGIVGLEALLRWIDPKYGLIPPEKFIPIAEESGLIVPLGEWVLSVACNNLKNLHMEGFTKLRMSVNLSARQFHRRDLLDVLERVLEKVGLAPEFLELEITERTAVMDLDSTTAMLYALSRKGIRLAIDDFGAGYSSMTYLKRFPIHCLKIDMSFIKDMETDPKDLAIIKAIITMAHGLGLNVVAEGVETVGQYDLLIAAECDHFQGHFFGKALPLDGIALLKKELIPQ